MPLHLLVKWEVVSPIVDTEFEHEVKWKVSPDSR